MSNPIFTRENRCDLFTRAECEQILCNLLGGASKCGKLLEFSVVPESGPIGYLGEYFHLKLKYQLSDHDSQETRLFVKTMPYQNADMSLFIEKSGILKKEVTLYETLLNELRKLTPTIWCAQCYLTRRDLLVMQNICDLGYEPMNEPDGFLKQPKLNVLLKGLATMHACSIAYEVRNGLSIGEQLKHVLYEVTVAPTVDWYTAGVRAVLAVAAKHPKYQASTVQHFISDKLPAILDTVYEMVNPSTQYRNVFCHRDPWGGNVFFSKSQPHEVSSAFVDFQLCRYCPPAIDVLMAVYMNMRPNDRRPIALQCYRNYYAHLAAELKALDILAEEHITWSDFERSLGDLQLFGAVYNCISATILRVPGDYLKQLKLNHPEDFHRYTNVDRTKEVLELVSTDATFSAYMFECIEDVMALVLD